MLKSVPAFFYGTQKKQNELNNTKPIRSATSNFELKWYTEETEGAE